jgi:hypothetical protein
MMRQGYAGRLSCVSGIAVNCFVPLCTDTPIHRYTDTRTYIWYLVCYDSKEGHKNFKRANFVRPLGARSQIAAELRSKNYGVDSLSTVHSGRPAFSLTAQVITLAIRTLFTQSCRLLLVTVIFLATWRRGGCLLMTWAEKVHYIPMTSFEARNSSCVFQDIFFPTGWKCEEFCVFGGNLWFPESHIAKSN